MPGQGPGTRRGRLIRADAKIFSQLLRRLKAAEIKQLRHQIDHIAGGSAAEAEEIIFIQLHAGVPVIVEGTGHHVISVHVQSTIFSGLFNGNSRFYGFKNVQVMILLCAFLLSRSLHPVS